VDALEGVGAQTFTVLRQAIEEKVKPILVLNKIDRLITELLQTPDEAYIHLNNILEQVNAILGVIEAQDILEDKESKEYYFAPEKGNVVFASAMDGWAFRTNQLANLYAQKLGMNELVLGKYLWGKYYLDPKTKKIIGVKGLNGRNLRPLFCLFVLDNIWNVYKTVLDMNDSEKVEKICKNLEVKVLPREIKGKDRRGLLQSIMSQWLPLSFACLLAVVNQVPSPVEAQKYRMESLLIEKESDSEELKVLQKAAKECDASDSAPITIYLSKMFTVATSELPVIRQKQEGDQRKLAIQRSLAKQLLRENKDLPVDFDPEAYQFSQKEPEIAQEGESFIGLCRIYSGTIKIGQTVTVLAPKYNNENPEEQFITQMKVERLFLLMGRDLEDLDKVPAGNVFGILCTKDKILKTATLTSTLKCPSLTSVSLSTPPILQVALEPKNPKEIQELLKGMRLLNRADPCVQVIFQKTGENVICCAGEIHLERCLLDLRSRFCKIELEASKPLVPFRETITYLPAINTNEGDVGKLIDVGKVFKATSDDTAKVTLRVVAVPIGVRIFLLNSQSRLERIDDGIENISDFISDLKKVWMECLNEDEYLNLQYSYDLLFENIICFGPKSGGNLLVNLSNVDLGDHKTSIITGFQTAASQGPLCGEPMAGVMVVIEEFVHDNSNSGQLLSIIRDSIKLGFLKWSSRLMLAYYKCELQTDGQNLGNVQGVLSRRRGKIVQEDIKDGTTLFTLTAVLPVVESFGFVTELLTKTSGVASPQLVFDGFEVLDIDPFWVPNTLEELEDLGEKAERDNIAKKYVESVRERRGMFTEKKLVEHGEKQRTLKSK
jgi:ribosome assembly protein 1